MIDPREILLDPEDEWLRLAFVWSQDKDGYAYSSKLRTRREPSFLHRMILCPPPGQMVDHINGNTLDNRRSNLRAVDVRLNGQNRVRLPRNNTSGHRGVVFVRNRWRAQAKKDGKKIVIGSFKDKADAIAAVRAWREANMPGITPFSVGHEEVPA